MKRSFIALLSTTLAFAGCVGGIDAAGNNAQAHEQRTFSAAAIKSLRVENVAGPIEISAAQGKTITVDAWRRASDKDALDRTRVNYDQSGDQLTVKTTYDESSGGFFSRHNGGSVEYRVSVPAQTDVEVNNVSGSIAVKGTGGDIHATEVSGSITVAAGRITPGRRVHLSAVSGPITLAIARDSNATLDANSLSGNIGAFFPADEHKGMVGSSLKGRIGKGDGTLTLSTVSGSISVSPQ